MPHITPYGTWTSPVTAELVAAGSLRLGHVSIAADALYWIEARPEEGGRQVLVRRDAAGPVGDVLPEGTNVRTRVHEYGGKAYVAFDDAIVYSEFTDQRLYRHEAGRAPVPLTEAGPWSFAELTVDPARQRLIGVRENHFDPDREAVTTLVGIDLSPRGTPGHGDVLVSGHDFYASPRVSPDGTRLAWIAWRHPQMPWDGTELWVADVAADGSIHGSRCAAGGPAESIQQPAWHPTGDLYFISDRSGWWNLYRERSGTVTPVLPRQADFGRAIWGLGTSTWGFAGPAAVVAAGAEQGRWRLHRIDLSAGTAVPIPTDLAPGETLVTTDTHLYTAAGSPASSDAIVEIELASGKATRIRSAANVGLEGVELSLPEAIAFPTEGGLTAHAFFYPPRNGAFEAAPGERPPLIVTAHGGPTAATNTHLDWGRQFWTSRGFAVVDVNYGGSTGYGRAYRERLRGQWGVVDVADCANAVAFLAERGRIDPSRVMIRGRSAGGYTTLAALTFRPDVFRAGASHYGVADLERLALDTHKFEARYLDGLVAPYPEGRAVYHERSPIHHVDRLSRPLILFQGLDDRVVPPNQATMMADAVRAKGLPVALVTFEGEQHGFRKAENIARCLRAELTFYGAIFGFSPPDALSDLTIDNL